ncbi:MobF family relaxase [Nocardia fusca]|uniref:MobF family relaxase n=1 Tax=Nocardia fusca TaxID=941183 RepID=UPI0007A75A49|nr:MobF family relaxase [Nocardia fusca]
MSLAKLGTGDGFRYYLRNIATNDIDDRGATQDLSSYYSERGEAPGRWIGSGLSEVGIAEGERVTESQMRALFGHGLHPNADAVIAAQIEALMAEGISYRAAKLSAIRMARLGRPFSVHTEADYSYRQECTRAYAAYNAEQGRVEYAPVPAVQRARIATEVAVEMFTVETGRAPLNAQELSGWVARASRPSRKTVSGFDLTFTPVKSVAAVWALASREVAAEIEAAHHAAIRDVIAFIERDVLRTRVGRHSVRQVEVLGLMATLFDHRSSRAGDPLLHTHVVISNLVKRFDGQWGCIDGRAMYRFKVAASEMYNTRLEHHLEIRLGMQFTERTARRGKRPVREVEGVDLRLTEEWSKRSAAIDAELTRRTAQFIADHGREPTPDNLYDLAQEATLKTRGHKPEARTRAEERQQWRADAAQVLGPETVQTMLAEALNRPAPDRDPVDPGAVAAQVVAVVAETRATWELNHVRAETERQLRGLVDPDEWATTVDAVLAAALAPPLSIPRGTPDPETAPGVLARSDGTSVYTTTKAQLFTSPAIVAAEQRLIAASLRTGGRTLPTTAVDAALVEFAANHDGAELNPEQQAMVRELAGSGARLQVAIAPAGTGKTTAVATLARAWTGDGGTVVGLAPTGAAAANLQDELGHHCATVDMLLTLTRTDRAESELPEWVRSIGPDTMVVLDEAAKTPTLALDSAVSWLLERGASIRAVGDDRQLASVAAGGVIRDIVHHAGAPTLTRVVRFSDPGEQAASLALREGDPAAIAYYADHNRIHVGALGDAVSSAWRGWRADTAQGRDSILLAPTRDLVGQLNALARDERLTRTGGPAGPEVRLGDGLAASAGDIITTRRNNYSLWISRTDHVRNGYRWQVRTVHNDGRITAAHLGSGKHVTLPADYVAEHVDLGYATTIDTAQGLTVDTCHGVLTGRESRAQLYVLATRARNGSHLYLATAEPVDDLDNAHAWRALHPPTALDLMTEILSRDGTQTSATTTAREASDPRRQFAHAVDAYLDALGLTAVAVLGDERRARLTAAAERLVPGITDEEAWPVLRQTLHLVALDGRDPIAELTTAVNARELDTADDKAAVLDWRIGRPTGGGPIDWLPALPDQLRTEPTYGEYLQGQWFTIAHAVKDIDRAARAWTPDSAPTWAAAIGGVGPDLLAELAIWRYAHAVPDSDRRPTGPPCYPTAERTAQQRLDTTVAEKIGSLDTHTRRWAPLAREVDERLLGDPYWPVLAAELSQAQDTGHDTATDVRAAAALRPLPYEQPAAALHWRLTDTRGEPGDREHLRRYLQADPLRATPEFLLGIKGLQLYEKWRKSNRDRWRANKDLASAQTSVGDLDKIHDREKAKIADITAARKAESTREKWEQVAQADHRQWWTARELLGEVKRWQWWLKADRQAAHDESLARYEKTQAGFEKAKDAARKAKTKAEKTAGASYNWDTRLTKAQTFIENYETERASRLERVASEKQRVAHHEQADQQLRARMQQMLDEKQRRIDMPEPQRRMEEALRDDAPGSTHEDAHDPEAWHVAFRDALSHPPEASEPHPYWDIDDMFGGSARAQAGRAVDIRMHRSGPSPNSGPSRSHGYGL